MTILLLSGSLMCLFLMLALYNTRPGARAEKRLQRIVGEGDENKTEEVATVLEEDDDSFGGRVGQFLSRFAGAGKTAEAEGNDEVYGSVRQRLSEAGFRRQSALAIYMGSRVVAGFGLAAFSIITSWSIGRTPPLLIIGMAAAIGYIAPGVIVDRMRAKRQAAVQRGLADAIDLMVVCVEAGLGLAATLSRVAREFQDSEPIIAQEFNSTVAETKAGRSLMHALRGMAKRTGNQDLSTLVALLIQTDRFGTPLTQTLRTQADSMRYERMQRAEEMAQRAPVKMMFPAGLIFMAVLMILGGPAAINIMTTLGGAPK